MADSNTFRDRRGGRLYFGDFEHDSWSIIDPGDPDLEEALHRMRYAPDTVDAMDRGRVIGAAEAYRTLCRFPFSDAAVSKFRAIRKAGRRA